MFVAKKDIGGRVFSIETGRIAKQASGSALVSYGESRVLVTACCGAKKEGDFMPLTIDYVEKTYAGGRIPGGFFKREGKLSEREILISRLMDRPCRPLFPEGFRNDTQVIATVISADEENDTDVMAVVGASAALTLSDAPFEGPIAAVRVSKIDGKLVINPPASRRKDATLDFVVAGTRDAIVMVEGGAKEVPEDELVDALFFAHKELQPLIEMQLELQKQAGKEKLAFELAVIDAELKKPLKAFALPKIRTAVRVKEKLARRDQVASIKEEMKAQFVKEGDEKAGAMEKAIGPVFEEAMYEVVREMIIKDKVRIDGRDMKTVRPISIEAGWLPRVHGSALFTRGETQAIVAATLGTMEEAQRMDSLTGEATKEFILHYNFPPFSVGETKPQRGPGRREIGHGALAERALKAMMPDHKDFPYVVRVVSEITESNGSSSMATVCGGSLALMDAGVPLKAPVAGVAMGLIKEGSEFAVLTDILGDEDHLGDMDFKVCGTTKGVTALQMDIKIKGLDRDIVTKALNQARDGRLHILSKMSEVLGSARADLSKYAPRITTFKISPDKIRVIIGPGGKMIRSIQESCGVKVEVQDDGTVSVASNDGAKAKAAIDIIKSLAPEAEIGKIYRGIVSKVATFGAFVEIFPGLDGLCHISELDKKPVNRVSDILSEGDECYVKVLAKQDNGKISLSRRAAMEEMGHV
jgi:polyribonucleotide nucleotidyltransferase